MSGDKSRGEQTEAEELTGDELGKATGGALPEFQAPEKIDGKLPLGPKQMDEEYTGPE